MTPAMPNGSQDRQLTTPSKPEACPTVLPVLVKGATAA
jgi:hypothetical protein